jgi:hypothetical protein
MLRGDVGSPEKHIHTNFHMSGLMRDFWFVGTISECPQMPVFFA